MTAITKIFDGIETRLNTIYSATHKLITDPYMIEENDDKSLARGYAWYFGAGNNSEVQLGCNTTIKRQVNFVLTVFNRGTDRDKTIRQNAEKILFEDLFKLISSVEGNTKIADEVATFKYLNDNGLEKVYTEANTFLMIRSTFEVHYIEEF